MRLSAQKVRAVCLQRGVGLTESLENAGVSRTAYYSLIRKESVLPGSIHALAQTLGVKESELLDERSEQEVRALSRIEEARRILALAPGASFENVWHALILLEESPIERLNRSLARGRAIAVHR